MSQQEGTKFCTVLNCIDGRVTVKVDALLSAIGLSAYMPDSPTIAGIVGRLSGRVTTPIHGNGRTLDNEDVIALLDWELDISVSKHGSEAIAIAGHFDCAGNPGDLDVQKEDVMRSIERVRTLSGGKYAHLRFLGIVYNEEFNPVVIYDSVTAEQAAAA